MCREAVQSAVLVGYIEQITISSSILIYINIYFVLFFYIIY